LSSRSSSTNTTLYYEILKIAKRKVVSSNDEFYLDITHDVYCYFHTENGAKELASAQSKGSPYYVTRLIQSRIIDRIRHSKRGVRIVYHESQMSTPENDDKESYLNSFADSYDLQEEYRLKQERLVHSRFIIEQLQSNISPKEKTAFIVKFWYELTCFCEDLNLSPQFLLEYIPSELGEREVLNILTHERSAQDRAHKLLFPKVDNDQELEKALGNFRTAYGRARKALINRARIERHRMV
jgi:hypothetical protein